MRDGRATRELVPAHVRHGRARRACERRPREQTEAFAAFVALLEEELEPDADAEHGPAGGDALAQHVRERLRARARRCAAWPTPATIASGAAATSAGSLVTTGSAPARASAEQTLRRLPAP